MSAAPKIGKLPEMAPNWASIARLIQQDFGRTREIFAAAGLSAEFFRDFALPPETGESYGRKMFYRTNDIEIMLALWPAGSECEPHDHGFSSGAVWLAQGSFVELAYALDHEMRQIGKPRVLLKDSLIEVIPGDIHSMRSIEDGLSVHIYSPPIQNMKVFDRQQRCTLTVADNCGAWLPRDLTQVIKKDPWPSR